MFFFTSYSFMSDFWPYKYSNYLPCVKYFTGAKYLLQSFHIFPFIYAYAIELLYSCVFFFFLLRIWVWAVLFKAHTTIWNYEYFALEAIFTKLGGSVYFVDFFFFFKLKWSDKSNVTWNNREWFLLWRRCYLIKTNELCKLFFMLFFFVWIHLDLTIEDRQIFFLSMFCLVKCKWVQVEL